MKIGASPMIFTPRAWAWARSAAHWRKKHHWQNCQKAMALAWRARAASIAAGARWARPSGQVDQSAQPVASHWAMNSA